MAAKKAAKRGASTKSGGTRKKTGEKRRSTQAKVGKPGVTTPPDVRTPESAAKWLEETGRSELSAGRTVRVTPVEDIDALPSVVEVCKEHAPALKERGVHPNLVAGAQLVAKKAAATESAEADVPAQSVALATTAATVARFRGSLNRLLPGARNAATRKSFGLHKPMHPLTPARVSAAAQGLIAGSRTAKNTPAAGFVLASDVKALQGQIKTIKAEQAEAATHEKQSTSQATTLDILTAGLELFFDKYAAGVGVVILDEVERLRALKLVPRREERRGKSEDGGGTGSGGGSGS